MFESEKRLGRDRSLRIKLDIISLSIKRAVDKCVAEEVEEKIKICINLKIGRSSNLARIIHLDIKDYLK